MAPKIFRKQVRAAFGFLMNGRNQITFRVSNNWTIIIETVIGELGSFLHRNASDYIVSIVRSFPVEMWELEIYVVVGEVYTTCGGRSVNAITKKLQNAGLEFLVPDDLGPNQVND